MNNSAAIALVGPTASGKTACALQLAQHFPVEIISIDSALIYRGLDIGTAKPSKTIRAQVPHHLIDILYPTESYSAARFRTEALDAMQQISERRRIPLLVGGTFLYLSALINNLAVLPGANADLRSQLAAEAKQWGWPQLHEQLRALDPVTAARLSPLDAQRIQRALEVCLLQNEPMSTQLERQTHTPFPYRLLTIALCPTQRAPLHAAIEKRFDQMLADGLVEELRQLRAQYALNADLASMRCVGYRQAWQFIERNITWDTLRNQGIAATRQLAKRQLTWIRRLNGIHQFDCLDPRVSEKITQRVHDFLHPSAIN